MKAQGRKKQAFQKPSTYVIRASGRLDSSWSDSLGGMIITREEMQSGEPVTVLYGRVADQAALIGALNLLYDLGLGLLTVECLTTDDGIREEV